MSSKADEEFGDRRQLNVRVDYNDPAFGSEFAMDHPLACCPGCKTQFIGIVELDQKQTAGVLIALLKTYAYGVEGTELGDKAGEMIDLLRQEVLDDKAKLRGALALGSRWR